MSTAAVNGGDAAKGLHTAAVASSKQQLKSGAGVKALDNARKQATSPVDGSNRKQQTPPPRAWQGTNPITQRASSTSQQPNGNDKPLPKLPTQPQAQTKREGNMARHAHDRLLWLMANFVGLDATVTLKNGEQFAGVFSGASPDPGKSYYTLKMVKQIRLGKHEQTNGVLELPEEFIADGGEDHTRTFDVQDIVEMSVPGVDTAQSLPHQNGSLGSSFRTDTEISSKDSRMPRERELQRWDAGADDEVGTTLEASGETGWDQFATNERMYGVPSTYDENIYTTAINRNDPEYKRKEAEAERIAREIERSTPADAHVAEERRKEIGTRGDGIDEEDKYSGVKRESAPPVPLPKVGSGSYVPPSKRPITNAPTVPGAPFDPAIISSQLAKPTSPASRPAPAPSARKTPEPEPIPVAEPSKGDEQKGKATDNVPKVTAPAAEPPKKPSENSAEDHVRSAADHFRQFANNEKLRVRQAQELKRISARNEKAVRLNDLKKFSLNFSLKSRVPDDLVPILAKDREKQLEIQRKADEAARGAEDKKRDELEKSKSASPPTSDAPPQAATTSLTGSSNTQASHRTRPSNTRNSVMQGTLPRHPSGQHPSAPRFKVEPLPKEMKLPDGTKIKSGPVEPLPLSPTKRLNVNAFEFKPAAPAFQPSGASPSPQRQTGARESAPVATAAPAEFFAKKKVRREDDRVQWTDGMYNIMTALALADLPEDQRKKLETNGGVPFPYMTPPTWTVALDRVNTSYQEVYPKSQGPSQGPSPMHTPNPSGHMPHQQQLPHQLQSPYGVATPQQQRVFQPHMDPRMQQYGPNGSVQNSPRFPPAQMAPAFNSQMPQMQMPQFGGQPMAGYGMSPSMQYRQPQGPPAGPMMMMPGQQHGQMSQMRPGQYPAQFQGGMPQMGGGQMMMPQHSNGPYMNGPLPNGYSPMPPHAQPHMQHMQHGGPAGYGSGSPRPPMMSHQGSHQGYNQQQGMHMQQQHFGQPSPGHGGPQHGPFGYQPQRQMSGQGYPHMTPRQQAAVPTGHVPSPQQHAGMGVPPSGDEGK